MTDRVATEPPAFDAAAPVALTVYGDGLLVWSGDELVAASGR